LSLEEAARAVRYGFLAEVAASIGAQSVAVGHTLDDQAETILLHLVRGTGTRGLRGLQPSAEWHADSQKLTVIRPLLEVRRAETGAYCADFNLKPRQDASNLSLEPLRNRVRLELLPLLNEYNPRMTEALQRTSALAGDDITHLQNEAAQLWLKIARIEGRAVMMDKQALLQLDLSMQRYVLRLAVEKAAGDLKDIEAQHIEALVQALAKPAGKKIILPYGLTFSVDYESFILVPTADNAASWPAPTGEYRLKIPGQTTVPGWKITARLARKPAAAAQNKNTVELDYAKTGGKLTVRARKNGDRFQPLGMPQTKNLAQFMLDAKIPQDLRDSIPLVVGETGIVWVGGCRVDERAKVTAETNQILRLKLEKT
jgi:tRNA(Ile)-lysidine synthase